MISLTAALVSEREAPHTYMSLHHVKYIDTYEYIYV